MVLQRTQLEKRLQFWSSDEWKYETSDFINPILWPHNSPGLNPVDYKIWRCMQEMVYKTKVRNVEDLHKRIMQAWNDLDQRIIDSTVLEWRKRQSEYKL